MHDYGNLIQIVHKVQTAHRMLICYAGTLSAQNSAAAGSISYVTAVRAAPLAPQCQQVYLSLTGYIKRKKEGKEYSNVITLHWAFAQLYPISQMAT